jgi:hypothetical protein
MAYIVGGYDASWATWDGDWSTLVEGEGEFSEVGHIRVEVQGNNYIGSMTGFDNLVVNDSSNPNGLVGIGVWCRFENACPMIDNFKVTYMP